MINSENNELAVTHDNEIAYVLSKFGEDFIYNTVVEALSLRLHYYDLVMPNIVSGYETMFKQILLDYPDYKDDILGTRENVYLNILKILCDFYQLQYEDYDTYNLYSSVSYMYVLLVSGFQQCVCNFFFDFITREKEGLYTSLNLDERKKNKDIGTVYTKKVFSDTKIGIICVNLDYVISSICCMDITFDQYIDGALSSDNVPEIKNHLKTVLTPQVDFFKTYIAPIVLESEYSVAIHTSVKLMLQNYSHNKYLLFNNEEDTDNE
jgi:hypothetical protein